MLRYFYFDSGIVSVGASLATYRAGPYSLGVEARDRGSQPRTDRATVLVYLRDENNFAPAFVYPNAFNATAFVRKVHTRNIHILKHTVVQLLTLRYSNIRYIPLTRILLTIVLYCSI